MDITLCYIREQYFIENYKFVKMLDSGNTIKQAHRTHLCLQIQLDNNNYLIPLRNNLGAEVRKFGRIGHAVPSTKRQAAGLDYRYALIVNDAKYIEAQTEQKIPNSQYQKITNDYSTIIAEFTQYIKGFKKAVAKGRNQKEPLYKESCLVNFIGLM